MANPRNEIVFVCTANTCRSPMAAALFRHALAAEEEPLKSLVVKSAGVSGYPGQSANTNSIAALKKVGVELSDHISSPITQEMIDNALIFVGMTDSHLAMLSYQIDPPPSYCFLMREFMEEGNDLQIPDPFGGSLSLYESSRDSMVEAIPSLIKAVKAVLEERDKADQS